VYEARTNDTDSDLDAGRAAFISCYLPFEAWEKQGDRMAQVTASNGSKLGE